MTSWLLPRFFQPHLERECCKAAQRFSVAVSRAAGRGDSPGRGRRFDESWARSSCRVGSRWTTCSCLRPTMAACVRRRQLLVGNSTLTRRDSWRILQPIYILTQQLLNKTSLRKIIAPSTLRSQRPLPDPGFLSNYILASFAFFARDTIFSYLLVVEKIQICLPGLFIVGGTRGSSEMKLAAAETGVDRCKVSLILKSIGYGRLS